jgi:hypothetical protein
MPHDLLIFAGDPFAGNTCLRALHLPRNEVTSHGLARFMVILPPFNALSSLDLSGNWLDQGDPLVACSILNDATRASPSSTNTTTTTTTITNTIAATTTRKHPDDGFALHVEDAHMTSLLLTALGACTGPEWTHLLLGGTSFDDDAQMLPALVHILPCMRVLHELSLRACSIRSEGLVQLVTALPHALHVLDLSENTFGFQAVQALADYVRPSQLRRLVLAQNRRIDDHSLAVLAVGVSANASLVSLNISKCNLSVAGVVALFRSVVKRNAGAPMEMLDLRFNGQIAGVINNSHFSKVQASFAKLKKKHHSKLQVLL